LSYGPMQRATLAPAASHIIYASRVKVVKRALRRVFPFFGRVTSGFRRCSPRRLIWDCDCGRPAPGGDGRPSGPRSSAHGRRPGRLGQVGFQAGSTPVRTPLVGARNSWAEPTASGGGTPPGRVGRTFPATWTWWSGSDG